MKNLITLLFGSALLLVLSSMELNSTGRAVHTGAPGEQTCARSGCHDSFALNSGTGSISIQAPGLENNQYIPGQTYTIQVTLAFTGRNLFGLGFEALLNSGANAGVLTAGAGNQVLTGSILGNVRNTITHIQNGGASPNTHTFQFSWTAPAAGAGTVTFYTAGVCANSNGGDSGDNVYSTSRTLNPLVAPTTPAVSQTGDNALCIGESSILFVSPEPGVTYTWLDQNGNTVATGPQLSVAAEGCYSIVSSNAAGSAPASQPICFTTSNPSAEFSGLSTAVCIDAPALELSPSQAGGLFAGNGINGNVFSPSLAGEGFHQVSYSITDPNGCSASSTAIIEVVAVPAVSFTVPEMAICANGAPVELEPSILGGEFTGNGVSGTVFNPALATIGTNTVTLLYVVNGCSSSYAADITVLPAPSAAFTGLAPTYCLNASDATLVPTESGGVFSGNGLTGASTFSPTNAGVGVWDILYSITLDNGCFASQSQQVSVVESGNSSFAPLAASYCTNDTAVDLLPTLQGGVFTGQGVTGSVFSPSVAGAGEVVIVYTLDIGDCSSQSSQTALVLPAPDASFTGLNESYCANDDIVILTPAVGGGNWSGAGVLGNTFYPQVAGEGTVDVVYTLVDENGCSDEQSQTVEILPLPGIELDVQAGTVTADAGADAYQWYDCSTNSPIAGATDNSYTSEIDGAFSVQITQNGCTATTECAVVEVVSVHSVEDDNGWSAFPNPAAHILNITHNGGVFSVEVYSVRGELVQRRMSAISAVQLDVATWAPGMYMIRVMTPQEVKTLPVVVAPH